MTFLTPSMTLWLNGQPTMRTVPDSQWAFLDCLRFRCDKNHIIANLHPLQDRTVNMHGSLFVQPYGSNVWYSIHRKTLTSAF